MIVLDWYINLLFIYSNLQSLTESPPSQITSGTSGSQEPPLVTELQGRPRALFPFRLRRSCAGWMRCDAEKSQGNWWELRLRTSEEYGTVITLEQFLDLNLNILNETKKKLQHKNLTPSRQMQTFLLRVRRKQWRRWNLQRQLQCHCMVSHDFIDDVCMFACLLHILEFDAINY